jgi:hypothetical protein
MVNCPQRVVKRCIKGSAVIVVKDALEDMTDRHGFRQELFCEGLPASGHDFQSAIIGLQLHAG